MKHNMFLESYKFLLLLVIFLNSQVTMAEYCPAYNDSTGTMKAGFYCPQELNVVRRPKYYCCRNTGSMDQYCCEDYKYSIYDYQHSSTVMWIIENGPLLAIPVLIGGFWMVGACTTPGSGD